MTMIQRLFVPLAVLVFAGVAGASAQAPAAAARVPTSATHVIRAGDILRIGVWPDSGLSGEFQVEDTGLLHLPGIGEVPVEGMTLQQLRDELRRQFGDAYKSPIVTVTPILEVGVMGAVLRPDIYVIRPADTLLDAIGRAGGLTRDADVKQILLLRQGEAPQTTSLEEALAGRGVLTTPARSGDRIIVGERRRVNFQSVVLALQSVVLLATLIAR
jgi:polysaccharide biosynthesis/export protein